MKVRRDDWGIPYLWADDADRLAFLQGRVTATDRAWQIEVERLRAEGRLAAVLGPAELPWDRFARRARLDDTARRCFARLTPETRRWVSAYVDGVNAGLVAADAPEFAAAGHRPGRWRPWTPLGVFLVQHALFGAFPHKLWRADLAAALGDTALFGPADPGGAGSNAWALAGPPATIAGDPHRLLELPGVYQQVGLACPEFDVVGLAFPGVPGVPHFGHAGGVAWGITNAMADYQDLYRERVRRAHGGVSVRGPAGWQPATVHIEHLMVRDGAPELVEVIETPRGPVIDTDRRTGEALSLRTPSRARAALGFDALLPLLRARRTADVVAALRVWVEPVNSVLVADSTGDVRSLVAGLVPVRSARCLREPVPAWDPAHAWHGWAPAAESAVDGVAVHANDRRAEVADLGVDFAPPHRARRIRELVDAGTAAAAIHTDVRGPVLRDLLAAASVSGSAAALRDRLLGWDGAMGVASVEAGDYAAWRSALVRRLHAHPVLRPLHAPSAYDRLFAPWTDPLGRIGVALASVVAGLGPALCAPVAAAALAEAAAEPSRPWGERHVLAPIQALPGGVPTAALAGDTDCVLATTSVPGVSDACWRGPVARYVWDLGDRAASRWIVPFGASGRPGDPHYADQLPLWAAGELIPVSMR
ncbi:penicillin acylase family protein [Asanoa sp. WMMD1127]|uniref:penicillin acylase family protein n=1 Tax=Asanoa sp. WMMD1127 TaxID=3016107 RepID=UPI002417B508|nr:penicillin acylase family protein [Asanoa sp. WMMD1127]MDG4824037.1 penicillin acylase family protein [Asanoa sp. WMMD1127]